MKKVWATFALLLISGWSHAYNTIFNPFTGKLDYVGVSSANIPSGSNNYIQNTSSLQSGATFYVSSGTVNGQLRVKNSFGGMTLYGGGAASPPGAYADGITMGFGGALANPTISIFGTPGVNDAGILVQGGGFSAGSSTNALSILTQFSSEVYLGNGLGTSGQVFTTGVNGAPTWTTPAGGGGSGGYALEPATVTAKFNVGMTASTATFSSSTTFNGIASFMQGITGTTFTFTGPTQSTITYGVSAGSLTLTGTGNATIIQNGLTGQVIISTPTATAGQLPVYGTSSTIIPTILRNTLIAVDANGVAISSTVTGGGTPASPTNSVQYNNAGAFGGSSTFQFNGTSVTLVSSAVISDTGRGSTNPGQLDLFQQTLSARWLTMGSTNGGQNQVVFADQAATILSQGVKPGDLRIGASGVAGQIDDNSGAGGSSQLINFESGSNPDITFQTCATCGNFIFKPGGTSEVVMSSFGITNSTTTTITSSLTVTGVLGISNTFGLMSATGTFINSLSATSLSVSTASTGVTQLAVSSAVAKAPTDPLLSISSASGTTILWIDNAGNLISSGTTTSVTSCGTSPSVLGNNIAGTITVGGGVVTSCTLNFANGGFVNVPVCIPSDNSATVSVSNGATTATSAVFNLSATLGGGLINYVCLGYQK